MPFGDIDEDAPAPRRTALDFIRDMQAQRKAAAVRTVQLRDTQRPEFVLTCRVPSDMDEMFDLETRAKEAATVEGSPSFEVLLGCMSLARYCTQITVNGRPVSTGEGSAFSHPELLETLGVTRGWQAVRQLFITDGGVYDDGLVGRFTSELSEQSGMLRRTIVVGSDQDPT